MDSLLFVSEIIVKVKSKCGNLELGNDCWWKYGGSRLHCFFFFVFLPKEKHWRIKIMLNIYKKWIRKNNMHTYLCILFHCIQLNETSKSKDRLTGPACLTPRSHGDIYRLLRNYPLFTLKCKKVLFTLRKHKNSRYGLSSR